jgi:hypothetical protein
MGNPELASISFMIEGKCRDFTPAALRFFINRAKRKSDSYRKISQIVTSMSEVRALAGEPYNKEAHQIFDGLLYYMFGGGARARIEPCLCDSTE